MRDGHPNSCAELSRWANRPASFVRKNKSGEERMCAYASTDNKADNSRAQVHRTSRRNWQDSHAASALADVAIPFLFTKAPTKSNSLTGRASVPPALSFAWGATWMSFRSTRGEKERVYAHRLQSPGRGAGS